MNDLHDWLEEINAKMVGLSTDEIEAGENCSCEFCLGPADVRSADPEPSNGFCGYNLASALTIRIVMDGETSILSDRQLTTCSWCRAVARSTLRLHLGERLTTVK